MQKNIDWLVILNLVISLIAKEIFHIEKILYHFLLTLALSLVYLLLSTIVHKIRHDLELKKKNIELGIQILILVSTWSTFGYLAGLSGRITLLDDVYLINGVYIVLAITHKVIKNHYYPFFYKIRNQPIGVFSSEQIRALFPFVGAALLAAFAIGVPYFLDLLLTRFSSLQYKEGSMLFFTFPLLITFFLAYKLPANR